MTRIFLIIISTLICKSGLTQSRLSYSFDFGPNFSYRTYKIKDYSNETDVYPSGKVIYDNFVQYYDEIEKPGMGFSLTLGINYSLTDWIRIRSGLGYKNFREKLSFTSPVGYYYYSGQTLVYYTSENNTTIRYNSYHYLTIPIDFQIKLLVWDKFSVGGVLGSDFDIKINDKLTNHSNDIQADPKYEFGNMSTIALNMRAGLILNYKIKENLSVYVQPEFNRYITPNIKYDIQPLDEVYCGINQFNYFGQIKLGININK